MTCFMAATREPITTSMSPRRPVEPKHLNAQQVTSIALAFLKSLGHRRGIKPRRVFMENQRYIVEVEIGKTMLAKVQVDAITNVITEYGIEKQAEEESSGILPVEFKGIVIMFGISIAVTVMFAIVNLQTILSGLL